MFVGRLGRVGTCVFALAAASGLSGCLGQSGSSSGSATASASTAPTATSAATPISIPATLGFTPLADGATAARVRVGETEGVPAASQLVTFAQALPPGLVRGHMVLRDGTRVLPTQVDVKRRHPDGTVRHAIVTTSIGALAASETRTLELVTSSATPPAGSVDIDAALAAGFDARVDIVDGGITYSLSARELLRAGTPERWIDGPLATEVRLAGTPRAGGAPHPALHVLFDVRFFANRTARVSVAVENPFNDTPGNRTYDVRVSVPGAAAFERTGLEHFFWARWRHVAWWATPASTLVTAVDWQRMADAAAISNYDRALAIDPAAITNLLDVWSRSNRDPMGTGLITGAMPMTGGRWDLGPLPTWTVLALLSADPRAYRAMLSAGDTAGAFSTHVRDRRDARMYSIDVHPTASFNPRNPGVGADADPADRLAACATCRSPYTADQAHQPSMAYVPYLVTGDAFYWDELKFWANYNFLEIPARDYMGLQRGLSMGLLHLNETRGQAWSMRTLGHTVWAAPETDADRSYFAGKLDNNFNWYRTYAVPSNPFGWWGEVDVTSNGRPQDKFSTDVARANMPWMNDFMALAFDDLTRMGFANARPIRDWLAGWTIMRFTTPAEYNPNEGDAYILAIRSVSGRAYSSLAEIYQMSNARRTTPAPTALSDLDCAFCYAAIAHAALAGPVRDRLGRAADARQFIGTQLAPRAAIFTRDPTWAIVP